MCQLCGCTEFIKQGKKAVLDRAMEIVEELGLTAQNVADYEDTELISSIIAPFGVVDDDAYQAAAWISHLHIGMGQVGRDEKYPSHVQAFRDIFARLPVQGDPKHIGTVYHQLEQLNKELDDASLAMLDPQPRQALQALRRVHDDPAGRASRLKQRYTL